MTRKKGSLLDSRPILSDHAPGFKPRRPHIFNPCTHGSSILDPHSELLVVVWVRIVTAYVEQLLIDTIRLRMINERGIRCDAAELDVRIEPGVPRLVCECFVGADDAQAVFEGGGRDGVGPVGVGDVLLGGIGVGR